MAVAVEQMADELTLVASLDERRALLGRRRLFHGLREWSTLLASGVIGVWLAALVALTLFNG
ncbi:MAG: hypothetical protein NVSMB29_19160 [Candidatus Dormibacteria bacterium]